MGILVSNAKSLTSSTCLELGALGLCDLKIMPWEIKRG